MKDEQEDGPTIPFPPSLAGGNIEALTEDELIDVAWSELSLKDLDKPFRMPIFDPHFKSVSSFVETELKMQLEIWRSEIHLKVNRNSNRPKPATESQKAEKHVHFVCPYGAGSSKHLFIQDLNAIHREPPRGQFTNYVVLLQTLLDDGISMENLTLAYTKYMRKKDGAMFALGKDYQRLRTVRAGTKIYVRFLRNASMAKTHLRAIAALKQSEKVLKDSYVTKQLLEGRINENDVHSVEDLDRWIHAKPDSTCTISTVNLQNFNTQQQRALAMDALTSKGVVLIQGPPGTGKSFVICHGILPQVVGRNEKVLLVCNSNVAVDALLLKCTKIGSLEGRMIRCGFKASVSEEIVHKGLYAEGDTLARTIDRYGNLPGSNSNTADANVQEQIRSKQVVFTTIHFASKEKSKSTSDAEKYWNFDTLVLDEAAQIEDSRLFIVLARCPTLKKIVLVGDPKQIQPYVPDSLRKQKYGQSTMERLMATNSTNPLASVAPYVMLEQQFRMAPMLRQVISHLYYNDRLLDGPNVEFRGPRHSLRLKPLLVVNLTGTIMSFSRLHQSYENVAEAAVCNAIYEFLFSSEFVDVIPALEEKGSMDAKDVCILTPYNRHKDQLRMKVCELDEDDLDVYSGQTYGRGTSGGGGMMASPTSPSKAQALLGTQDEVSEEVAAMVESIDTVDKFQGSERKVVIISTCVDRKPLRAADPHFINVACSRAQHLLIVVGNFTDALVANSDWSFVLKKAKEFGSYLEHKATMLNDDDGDKHRFDIHEDELKSKLRELVRGQRKREREDDSQC